RHLAEHQPEMAARVLTKMTKGGVAFSAESVRQAGITTQVTTDQGRPDMEISLRDCLVYVEAKVESGLGIGQLGRYREELKRSGRQVTALVLLTRYPISIAGLTSRPDAAIRWHDIAQWLSEERITIQDQISAYLTEQFLGYLKARRMTVEPVTWELR